MSYFFLFNLCLCTSHSFSGKWGICISSVANKLASHEAIRTTVNLHKLPETLFINQCHEETFVICNVRASGCLYPGEYTSLSVAMVTHTVTRNFYENTNQIRHTQNVLILLPTGGALISLFFAYILRTYVSKEDLS